MSATLGLGGARALDPRAYRLGAHEPRLALRPASAAEVAEALVAASRERLKVVAWGGGTRLRRVIPSGGYDVALDLSGLARIVEYDPEDLTLTAECGATLASLRAALSAHGQELPLESPGAERATLGGTLAWNGSGPRRLRFGSPADRILGARFALTDGTIARTGGKVVKNVAGFAVHRLLCGSRGGLAVILEASLKLPPAPAKRVALIYGMTRWQIVEAERWKLFPRLEPSFVSVLGSAAAAALPDAARVEASFLVVIGLEDGPEWVAEQESRVAAALGSAAARVEGDEVIVLSQTLTDVEHASPASLSFASAHNTPAGLAPLLDRAGAESLIFHAPAGRLHWSFGDGDASRLVRDFLAAGYTAIDSAGVTFEDPVPPEVAALTLRERVRLALDPTAALSRASR